MADGGLGTTIAAGLNEGLGGTVVVSLQPAMWPTSRLTTRADGEAVLEQAVAPPTTWSAPCISSSQMVGSGAGARRCLETQIQTGPTLAIHSTGSECAEIARLRRQQAALAPLGTGLLLGEPELGGGGGGGG